MIMAGRGRRLQTTAENTSEVGSPRDFQKNKLVDLPLLNKIMDIDAKDINMSLLSSIQSGFKQLFTSKDVITEVVSTLHAKALLDAELGEKIVLALEQVSHFEVDGTLVRGELLTLIQNDFKIKETTYESDLKTFLNSVLLLGNVYHRFKVCGAPIAILGVALLEYFDLLIKGKEEELKVLTKQLFINGAQLSQVKNYEALMEKLRTTLVTKNLNSSSRCWILLSIDFMLNDLKPLNGIIKDFYVKNLGEEYLKLESLIPVQNEPPLQSSNSFNVIKSPDSTSLGNKNFNISPNKNDGFKRDLTKKFSDMSVKSGFISKDRIQSKQGRNKKDFWKSGADDRKNSGHDDRFDKEENFYGAQKPRQPKAPNQKKKFNDTKVTMKEDDIKTDLGKLESGCETENKFQN